MAAVPATVEIVETPAPAVDTSVAGGATGGTTLVAAPPEPVPMQVQRMGSIPVEAAPAAGVGAGTTAVAATPVAAEAVQASGAATSSAAVQPVAATPKTQLVEEGPVEIVPVQAVPVQSAPMHAVQPEPLAPIPEADASAAAAGAQATTGAEIPAETTATTAEAGAAGATDHAVKTKDFAEHKANEEVKSKAPSAGLGGRLKFKILRFFLKLKTARPKRHKAVPVKAVPVQAVPVKAA